MGSSPLHTHHAITKKFKLCLRSRHRQAKFPKWTTWQEHLRTVNNRIQPQKRGTDRQLEDRIEQQVRQDRNSRRTSRMERTNQIIYRQIGDPQRMSHSNHQERHSIPPIAKPTNGSKLRKATPREADIPPIMHTWMAKDGIPIHFWRETTIVQSIEIAWMPIIPSIAMCMCPNWPSSARSNTTIASIDQAILYTQYLTLAPWIHIIDNYFCNKITNEWQNDRPIPRSSPYLFWQSLNTTYMPLT